MITARLLLIGYVGCFIVTVFLGIRALNYEDKPELTNSTTVRINKPIINGEVTTWRMSAKLVEGTNIATNMTFVTPRSEIIWMEDTIIEIPKQPKMEIGFRSDGVVVWREEKEKK